MATFTPFHKALVPGSTFPVFTLPKAGGSGVVTTAPQNGKPKMIVVYRGQFCPFCRGTLSTLETKYKDAMAAGFDVVAISADKKDKADALVEELKLSFDVGCELTEEQILLMGTFFSDPTHYIEQKHRFSEPASFVLKPDGTIKYMELATAPMMGRINVDAVLAGYQWSTQNAIDHPEFQKVVWGSLPNN